MGALLFFGAPGRIDQNSFLAVLTLRAPSASKTLARFIEPEGLISVRTSQTKKGPSSRDPLSFGAPGRIRTSDRLVRSQVLYPAELRALGLFLQVWALAYRKGRTWYS